MYIVLCDFLGKQTIYPLFCAWWVFISDPVSYGKNLAFCKITLNSLPFVQVSLPEAEVKSGLALQPQALEVSLVDQPLTDLLFTQFMASVSGKVYCLGKD